MMKAWPNRNVDDWAVLLVAVSIALLAQTTDPEKPQQVYRIGGAVLPPQLIHKVEPQYAEKARRSGLEGTVVLYVVVDENGRPRDLKVVKGLGKGLDEAATKAVQQWQFKPGTKDGVPVAVSAQIEINFRLSDSVVTKTVGSDARQSETGAERTNGSADTHASYPDRAVSDTLKTLAAEGSSTAPETANEWEKGLGEKDSKTRAKLLAFYATHADVPNYESVQKSRARHIFWLILNDPEASVLGLPLSLINRSGEPLADESSFQQGKALWQRQVLSKPDNLRVLEHAALFTMVAEKETSERFILALMQKDHTYTAWLGELYALAALGITALDIKTGEPLTASEAERQSQFGQRALSSLRVSSTPEIIRSALTVATEASRKIASVGALPNYQTVCHDLVEKATVLNIPYRVGCDGVEQPTPTRIRVGGNVQAANLIKKVAPSYPEQARAGRVQGTVRFTVVIGADGTIKEVQLVSGHPLLVDAAAQAVRQWRYKPTLLNGRAVEVVTQIDVYFTLSP
jgi:TonB family protein